MPPSLSEEIVAVLKESQSNVHSHQRLLKTLRGLHDKHTDDLEGFFEAYFKPFSNALVVFKREAAAQRVIELTAKFAISTAQQESGKHPHTPAHVHPHTPTHVHARVHTPHKLKKCSLDQHNYFFPMYPRP